MRLRRRRSSIAAASPPPLLYRWDLDKTYLRSEFETIRQLLRTAFERPEQKVDVPGVAEVIRGVKRSAERQGRSAVIYFISASPPQIGKAIRAKLALDGVPYDGIVFKNQLESIRKGKFRNLREHVGFKLVELLRGRLAAAPDTREFLFGDDWESDSLIYSLYADILAGQLGTDRLAAILSRIRVDPQLVTEVLALVEQATGHPAVERIFINLEKRTPPATFRLFGPRVVPTFNYFQTAAVLAAGGALDVDDTARVGQVLLERSGYTPRRLENSLDDLIRRGHLTLAAAEQMSEPLRLARILPPGPPPGPRWRRLLVRLGRGRDRKRRDKAAAHPENAMPDYELILDRLRPSAARPTVVTGGPG